MKRESFRYLTRPINPLFHILAETFQIDAFGRTIVGGILLATTVSSIAWPFQNSWIFLVCILLGDLNLYPPWKSRSQYRFWTVSQAPWFTFYMFNDLAKYPISIYTSAFRCWLALSCLSPYGLLSCQLFLADKDGLFNIGGLMLISLFSLLFLKPGIGLHAESVGS